MGIGWNYEVIDVECSILNTSILECNEFDNEYLSTLIQVSSLLKNLEKKEAKETGPQVAKANLCGPDSQLLKDKINHHYFNLREPNIITF